MLVDAGTWQVRAKGTRELRDLQQQGVGEADKPMFRLRPVVLVTIVKQNQHEGDWGS